MPPSPPPPAVLRAFGARAAAVPVPGGQGTSWRTGDLVLKPGSAGAVDDWLCDLLSGLADDEVRLARPVRSRKGTWSCHGWSATRWVEGRPADGVAIAWPEVVEAGRAFHRAVSRVPRPACLDLRDDPWARADRLAWGERDREVPPGLTDLARRLRAALAPLGPAQLVHGDLTTNVLFAPGTAPAVIDVSPYWRPTAFAEGVVVADALGWHGASPDLLDAAGVPVAAVARALLFRMATTAERVRATASARTDLRDEVRRCERAATAIGV